VLSFVLGFVVIFGQTFQFGFTGSAPSHIMYHTYASTCRDIINKLLYSIAFTKLVGSYSSTSHAVLEEGLDPDSWGAPDFFLLNTAGRFHFFMRNRYVNV
jgi:hypothetical protein